MPNSNNKTPETRNISRYKNVICHVIKILDGGYLFPSQQGLWKDYINRSYLVKALNLRLKSVTYKLCLTVSYILLFTLCTFSKGILYV